MAGDGAQAAAQRGAQIAVGILLLWFGGACLFVAFMSGKTPSLVTGTDRSGKPQGPKDITELLGRVSGVVQAANGSQAEGEAGL